MSSIGRNLDVFEILVKQNYEIVYKSIYLYTKDKWIAEDAVQQAFIIAYNKLEQLKSKDKFASWVIAIALNEAKKMLNDKNNSKVTSLTLTPLRMMPDDEECAIILKEDVRNILRKLEKKQTEILILKYYADLTMQQITDILGLNLSNAKVRLHRAREKFRELIDKNRENIGG